MKKVTAIFASFMMLATIGFSQATQIPEFKNVPMLLKADGSLAKLEKQVAEVKSKTKGFSYGASVVTFVNILGEKSPVVIDPSEASFIVKLPDADTDPETAWNLTKVIPAKKSRELELAQSAAAIAGAFGAKGKSVKRDDIKLEYEKVEPGVYKFRPVTPLVSGTEYALQNTISGGASNTTVFLFGTSGTAPKKGK
ncbi:MAG: hypothetical protein KF872_11600 [Chitinophagales bacterium]|nr:hypothetical protein [Chitinophagales bacterium]